MAEIQSCEFVFAAPESGEVWNMGEIQLYEWVFHAIELREQRDAGQIDLRQLILTAIEFRQILYARQVEVSDPGRTTKQPGKFRDVGEIQFSKLAAIAREPHEVRYMGELQVHERISTARESREIWNSLKRKHLNPAPFALQRPKGRERNPNFLVFFHDRRNPFGPAKLDAFLDWWFCRFSEPSNLRPVKPEFLNRQPVDTPEVLQRKLIQIPGHRHHPPVLKSGRHFFGFFARGQFFDHRNWLHFQRLRPHQDLPVVWIAPSVVSNPKPSRPNRRSLTPENKRRLNHIAQNTILPDLRRSQLAQRVRN